MDEVINDVDSLLTIVLFSSRTYLVDLGQNESGSWSQPCRAQCVVASRGRDLHRSWA